jgi:hypothetical protein
MAANQALQLLDDRHALTLAHEAMRKTLGLSASPRRARAQRHLPP